MGLFATVAQRPRPTIHELHSVEESGNGRVQNRRSARIGQTVGHPEESSQHELRQNVTRPTLLLSRQYTAQGPRRTTLLPVSIVLRI